MQRSPEVLACVALAGLASYQSDVTPLPGSAVVAVQLDPAALPGIQSGDTVRLRLRTQTEAGATTVARFGARLLSRDTSVATVSATGLLTAVSAGRTYVTVAFSGRAGTLTDSVAAEVVCVLVPFLRFNPPSQTLTVDESFTPTVTVNRCDGLVTLSDSITRQGAQEITLTGIPVTVVP